MRKQDMQDERLTAQRRKIHSEAQGILMLVLLASTLVQQFLLKAPFEQYAVEAICFFGMSLYTVARYLALGIDMYGEGGRAEGVLLINSVVTGTVVTAVNGALNYAQYARRYQEDGIGFFIAMLAVTFVGATVCSFIVLSLLAYLNKKKQAAIQKRLDEEERDG